jgi:hypothetical protein
MCVFQDDGNSLFFLTAMCHKLLHCKETASCNSIKSFRTRWAVPPRLPRSVACTACTPSCRIPERPNPGIAVAHNYRTLQKNARGISLGVKTTPCLESSTNCRKTILFTAVTNIITGAQKHSYVLDSIHVLGMMKMNKKCGSSVPGEGALWSVT